MIQPGPHNDLTDVAGLTVGHYSDPEAPSGTTVVLCPDGAVGGVDVRGAAPGTRETDLLSPENLVDQVQAVTLSGGSVYGLAASQGVVDYLAEKKVGFPLGPDQVAPIVPGAILFDLGRGPSFVPPVTPDWGRWACEAAGAGPVKMGNVGAGTGAQAGSIKGGLGSASEALPSGLVVAALVAVNSFGSVVDPHTGRLWEADAGAENEFGPAADRRVALPPSPTPEPAQNTTIGLVATDASLTKPQAMKMAQAAHDGLARAIRPAHTMFDGDTVFALATGRKPLPEMDGPAPTGLAMTDLGRAAADCFARAVIRAVLAARTLAGITAFVDLPDRR